MSMYDNIKAAMNNAVPPANKLNQTLFNTDHIENDNVKAFIEAKGDAANAASEMNALKARGQFYFNTSDDEERSTELQTEMAHADAKAKQSVHNVNWDELSKSDYEAALNASCGVNNKQGGLDEKIQNKALIKLTLESMSKEDIAKSFDMFMSPAEQEKWLTGIANDEHYKQYIPDEDTLNAYVEETKNAMLDKEPRPDPSNAFSLDCAVMDTLEDIHAKHTAALSDTLAADKQKNNAAIKTPVSSKDETKTGLLSKFRSRFSSIPDDIDKSDDNNGFSL